MTRKYAIQLLPLIEAWLKGETIQVKNITPQFMPGEWGWVDLPDVGTGDEIVFALPLNYYRVKPTETTGKRNFWQLKTMTKQEQQQAVQLAKRFIREMHPKEIKENPALQAYLIEGFIAGYHGAVCTASSWFSVDECLPERDAECIVLDKDGRISFGHIVDPDTAESHDRWNFPGIKFWMEYKPIKGMPI